ncbi:MAG: hypothetical protein EU547_07745 [Promethearchaeota archaeon]|nr:MAG: hypothetical protein EU547_07745 [Candidatus Lokiarchaeota archaeon]
MYKIEKINGNKFFVKLIGTFPPSIANKFSKEFLELTKNLDSFSVIVDVVDGVFLKLDSIEIVLDLLSETNKKLIKSSFLVPFNPPLKEEIKYVLEKADSPKRKIVYSLDEAKEWIGISDIIIRKD